MALSATRLSRSDSSSSWRSLTAQELPPQRRIRHLQAVVIRNLSLNPRRDHLSSLLHAPTASTSSPSSRPRIQFAADDTDLHMRTRRRRAGSNASSLGTSGAGPTGRGGSEELAVGHGASGSGSVSSGSGGGYGEFALFEGSEFGGGKSKELRRGGSAGAHGIREEVEPPSPRAELDDPLVDSPEPSTLPTEMQNPISLLSASAFPSMRKRSTSRASLMSINTIGSGSTVRATAPTPATVSTRTEPFTLAPVMADFSRQAGRMSYSSEVQLAKEKQRRIETLRRRLVDSFITLSVVPSSDAMTREVPRKRGTSSSSIGPRGKLVRSNSSANSIPRGRNSPHSTPPVPPTNLPPAPSSSSSSPTPPPPFFISETQQGSTHPTFEIDSSEFLLEDPEEWTGLREGRVVVNVWTRSNKEFVADSDKGKGKESDEQWTILLEWDVDFDGLISLGRDPVLFPVLPPNTLIFRIHDEYFTAPLPSSTQRTRAMYSSESDSSDSESGNLSDPGTVALNQRRRQKDVEAEEHRRRRSIVEKSVRETRMVKAANLDSITRLLAVENELRETRTTILESQRKLDSAFDPGGVISLTRERDEIKDKVDDLTAYQAEMVLDLDDLKAELNSRRRALKARSERLTAARAVLERSREEVQEEADDLHQDEKLFATTQQAAKSRRTQLITLLSQIFPIDAAEDSSHHLLFTIVGTALPNSSYPSTFSDETLSSALGYAAQVMSMLSAYVGVPLHYPIQCLGSRSAVLDLISVMRGPRAFPLYGKGVDKYRFDYGVFLLNKNIEQLMYSQSLTVPDLRNTLPNLKGLILSLSYDPSHSEWFASTLTVPPRFDAPTDTSSSENLLHHFEEMDPLPTAPSSIPITENHSTSDTVTPAPAEEEARTEEETPHSPSTIKALSIRSVSPASTVRGVNGTHPVIEVSEPPEEKVTTANGDANGKVSFAGKGKGIADFLKGSLSRATTSNNEGVV